MSICQLSIRDTKERISIGEVIGAIVPLKRRGNSQTLWGCCPFHKEKTPSFSVNIEKGFFKCFGCDRGGDAITFLQELKGMSYLEVMEEMARKYGVTWKKVTVPEAKKRTQALEKGKHLLAFAQNFYEKKLAQAAPAKAYLETRGIPMSLVKKFGLGYSPNAWRTFFEVAQQKGYHLDDLVQAGLVIAGKGRPCDYFRGRLLFPIYNARGQVVGFAGRVLAEESSGPKYLNSSQSVFFQKSKLLYGLFQAKAAIRAMGHCYVVEGYTDLLALHQAGIEAVVATSGTALSTTQANLLKGFTNSLTLLFDGDDAGVKAALRGAPLLLAAGFDLKVVAMPLGEDPANYQQVKGAPALVDYLNQHATDTITFAAQYYLNKETAADPIKERKAIQALLLLISAIPDELKRELYIKRCSKLTGISVTMLSRALASELSKEGLLRPRENTPLSTKMKSPKNREEIALLNLLFNHGQEIIKGGKSLADYLLKELEAMPFEDPSCVILLKAYRAAWERNKGKVEIQALLSAQPGPLKKIAIELLASRDLPGQKDPVSLAQIAYKRLLYLKFRSLQKLFSEARETLLAAKDKEVEGKVARYRKLEQLRTTVAKTLGMVVLPVGPN